MSEKVTKLALASRVIVLIVQFVANTLIPDHNPDVFKSPKPIPSLYTSNDDLTFAKDENFKGSSETFLDKFVEFCFGGLRRWDAEYFLHIAEHKYSYENTLAFYPLYPMVIRTLAKGINLIIPWMSLHSISLLVGILINIYCFNRAANCLFELTQRLFGDVNKSWNATVMFCFNPASIFFTALYTESMFCWLSFSVMLECIGHLSLARTAITLALNIICRSNGLVNIGFPIYFICRRIIRKPTQICWMIIKMFIIIFVSIIPLTVYNFYAFQLFCTTPVSSSTSKALKSVKHAPEIIRYAAERDYILAGHRLPANSPWCDQTFPFPYSYIQSHYWNVGFLKYYEFKQIPNFILAAPIIGFMMYRTMKYFRHIMITSTTKSLLGVITDFKSLPFVLHSLFLTLFCIFFVHIQVSTRLISSATPCLYWFAAEILPKTFDKIEFRSKNSLLLLWFSGYYLIGTILFSNFLPWT